MKGQFLFCGEEDETKMLLGHLVWKKEEDVPMSAVEDDLFSKESHSGLELPAFRDPSPAPSSVPSPAPPTIEYLTSDDEEVSPAQPPPGHRIETPPSTLPSTLPEEEIFVARREPGTPIIKFEEEEEEQDMSGFFSEMSRVPLSSVDFSHVEPFMSASTLMQYQLMKEDTREAWLPSKMW